MNDWIKGVKRGATSTIGNIDDDIRCVHAIDPGIIKRPLPSSQLFMADALLRPPHIILPSTYNAEHLPTPLPPRARFVRCRKLMTSLRIKLKQQGWTADAPLTQFITITDFTTEEPAPATETAWTAPFPGGSDDILMEHEDIAF